jgi:outer membrane protein
MRRSALSIVLASSFVLPRVCSANDLLDLYHQALEQDTTLRAAKFQRDAAVEVRPQALSAFLPQLSADAGITRTRNEITTTSTRIITDPTNPAASVTTSNTFAYYNTNNNYQVTLTQTIWSFETFRRLKEASVQVAQAEASYRSAQQALILRVAQAYFNVLGAVDTVRTNKAERSANERQLQQAQKRFDVGLAAITDVQEAQASYDTSNATLIASERTLSNAKRALAEITGHYQESEQTLRDEIPLASPNPVAPDAWLQAARKENYDVQVAQLQAEAAERNVGVLRARHLPTLYLQGSYGSSNNTSNFNSDSSSGSVGVRLTIPIYTGGNTSSLVRQAVATYEQNRASADGTLRSVERQTRDAFEGVMSGIASVKANQQSVKSNQTALESSQLGLQVGTRTEVDVLNTLRNLFVAQRTFYQSRYDYLVSVLTLKQQAGRLTEVDLSEIDALLVPAPAQ